MNTLERGPILWPFIGRSVSLFRASAPLRPCVEYVLLFSTAVCVSGAEIPRAPVPKSPYIAVVYRYADTMLEKGRDTYGPQQTGLFLSALDRMALAALTNRPAAPAGVREADRAGSKDGSLVGVNPQHDENLLRLLYLLSELTTKPKYRDAANASLKWFLQNAQSPATGLLPWGERMSWDAMSDTSVVVAGTSDETHQFFRPWLLWDRCFELAPEASKRFASRLAEEQIAALTPGALERQSGFYIRTWAAAYARMKDERFLKAIGSLLERFEKKLQSKPGPRTSSALSLAIDCEGAAHLMPGPLAARLRTFAVREDEIFCGLPHDLKKTGGFISSADPASGRPSEPPTPRWNARSGDNTTAQVGLMCVARYDNGGSLRHRSLLLAAADAYLDSLPSDGEDIWPGTFGHAISLQVAAWRHSARPVYFERARKFADIAIEKFFGTNALPRASFKSEHYESITGADTLALALTELHLQVLHITAVRCPPNTIDR